MIHLILHYLLALPDETPTSPTEMRMISAARKRKSMDLATMVAAHAESGTSPTIYNLVDLILGSLHSESQQTVAVSLQLVSVLLLRHHRYAVTSLVRTGRAKVERQQRPIGAHEAEVEFLLTLAGQVSVSDNIDEAYENHVKDSMSLLESHACSQSIIGPSSTNGSAKLSGGQASLPGAPRDVRIHTLRIDDPLLKALLNVLRTFFTNPVETNLSLTEAIVDLAVCGFMDTSGWLLPDPSLYNYENDSDEEDKSTDLADSAIENEMAQIRATRRARHRPENFDQNLPNLLQQLNTLVTQVSMYRESIPRFDDLLLQRRTAFQMQNSLQQGSRVVHQSARSSLESVASRQNSPARNKPSALDSLAQRIFPDLNTPSRSNSPRGRSRQERGSKADTPIPKQGVAAPAPPARSPNTPSQSRRRAYSRSPLRAAKPSVEGSHALAFREDDGGILNREVEIPGIPSSSQTSQPAEPQTKSAENVATSQSSEATADGTTDSTSTTALKDDRSNNAAVAAQTAQEKKTVSVSHVLTNVIVLQEFLLELAALVQVRAGLFAEVRFV